MRRPAVFISAAFGTGILAGYYLNVSLMILFIMETGLLAYVLYLHLYDPHNIRKNIGIIVCIILLGNIWFGVAAMKMDPLINQSGKTLKTAGIITEADVTGNKGTFVINCDSAKSIVKYYGDCDYLKQSIGKSVEVYGRIELPQERRNPKCFDYRLYLKSCNIKTIIYAESIKLTDEKTIPYLKWTGAVRNTFSDKVSRYVNDYKKGLIMAIIFGDKTMMDEEVYSDFQRNGTAHVLAVSGLHMGIIYAFFVFLWRGKKGSLFYIMVSGVILFYTSLADFSPSVVRAACMIFLHLTATLLKRRYDLLTAASLTFLGMLLFNPYQLFHVGFQLSFLAIVSLAVIIPFVQRFYTGIFLSAIAIQAGMVPYTAFVFNYISLGAVLANIPVVFIAGIVLPIGVCALICMTVPGELFGFLIKMVDLCCEVMIKINDFFYASGKTSFDVISPPVWVLVIYYGILFLFLSETGQILFIRKKVKTIILSLTGVITIAFISVFIMATPFDNCGIVFVDVGQGDCIHIKTDSGKNYLIDGGGKTDYDVGMKILKPYLLKNGVRKIDAAFVTHLHEDHYGGIRSLADDGMVEMIGTYEANRQIEEKLKKETSAEIVYLHRGFKIDLDDNVYIEIISPEAESEDAYIRMMENQENENDLSLIMKVSYKNVTLLITGDIDEQGEEDLIKHYDTELACDIMKVPHHGSKYSSSENFIETVCPQLAVFQVGRNNYGHPSAEAMERYQAIACQIVRNDMNGAIGLIIGDNSAFEVIKMID